MGTQGADVIVGTAGDDQIFGLGGSDTICAMAGNDQISGGFGDDRLFGQGGNDTFIWNPGDSNDRIEGGSESDTLQMAGSNIGETIDLSANGNRLRLTRNIANIALDVAGVERVDFDARGGTDLIVINRLVGTAVQQVTLDLEGLPNSNTPDGEADSIILFGGPGNDQVTISNVDNQINVSGLGPTIEIHNPEGALDSLGLQTLAGDDRVTAQGLAAGLIRFQVEGGPGNDTITGSQGPDALVGGADNDTFVWTLGTPADLVGGEAGIDTLQVVGTADADNVTLAPTATGIHVLNVSDGAATESDVEQVVLQAGRGADQIAVVTLAGSTLQKITLDLRLAPTGTAGDGAADALSVITHNGVDNLSIAGSAGSFTVSGLAPTIVVQGSEGVRDTLNVNLGFEADTLNAQALAAGLIRLTVRGGSGADFLTGSLGDDVFTWSPGDGNDVIEGGLGNDTLQFNGSGASETIGLTANGSRLRFTRDVAAIDLDVNGVERVTYAAQGGADTISIGDLASTNVKQVAIDLGSTFGGGDGQPDTIQITSLTATPISTTVGVGTMTITWSPVTISVTNVEPTNDRFTLQTPEGPAPPSNPSVSEPETAVLGEGSGATRP